MIARVFVVLAWLVGILVVILSLVTRATVRALLEEVVPEEEIEGE
jgi:hypothetical protein